MIFVTGGAGFIGSNFILNWLSRHTESILNIDKLTYAGNLENLKSVASHTQYRFAQLDILDQAGFESLLKQYQPRAIIHFAAESHVDRSIVNPKGFLETNVMGTFSLLQATHDYWKSRDDDFKKHFRFLHVSTDEVFGSLELDDEGFNEKTPYAPNSPYSASKAGSDHLVRAFYHTHGLPVLTTNCSNNFGPYQFPEKLIPLVIHRAIQGEPLPIYGNGLNIRDWLYVTDHCEAIEMVLQKGNPGETYNIGSQNEKTNIEIVDTICDILDVKRPRANGKSYKSQKIFIQDRAGHDKRYAINSDKIKSQIGWIPRETFLSGLDKTVKWYLDNEAWVQKAVSSQHN